MSDTKIFADGFAWGEGLRWHNDRLYFSDIYGKKVYSAEYGKEKEIVLDLHDMPSGLGFLPDDSLLAVSGGEKKILRVKNGKVSVYADLSELCVGINDMVTDESGNVYVGAYGYEMQYYKGGKADGWVFHISPDGKIRKVCEGLQAPNGMAILQDGKTLIVADTFRKQLVAYTLNADGIPAQETLWAQLSSGPDGICADEENCVWAAIPGESKVARIERGGRVAEQVAFNNTPLCCTLGGKERKTLFVVTVPAHNDLSADELSDFDTQRKKAASCICCMSVKVSGAGFP